MEAIALDVAAPDLAGAPAGVVCADASVVAPNNEAATKTEKASLERMEISSINQMMQTEEPFRTGCVPPSTKPIAAAPHPARVIQIKTWSAAMDETSLFR